MADSDRSALMPQKSNMPDLGSLLKMQLAQQSYNQRGQQSIQARQGATGAGNIVARLKSYESDPAKYEAYYNSLPDIGADKYLEQNGFSYEALAPVNVSQEAQTAQATREKTIDQESSIETLLNTLPQQLKLEQQQAKNELALMESEVSKEMFRIKSERKIKEQLDYKRKAVEIDGGVQAAESNAKAEKEFRGGYAGYMQDTKAFEDVLNSGVSYADAVKGRKNNAARMKTIENYMNFGNEKVIAHKRKEQGLYAKGVELLFKVEKLKKSDRKTLRELKNLGVSTPEQVARRKELLGKVYTKEDQKNLDTILYHLKFNSANEDNPSPFYNELVSMSRHRTGLYEEEVIDSYNAYKAKDVPYGFMGFNTLSKTRSTE